MPAPPPSGQSQGCASNGCGCGCLGIIGLMMLSLCSSGPQPSAINAPVTHLEARRETPEPPLPVPTRRPTPTTTPTYDQIYHELQIATQKRDLAQFKAAFEAAQAAEMTTVIQQLESAGWIRYFREQELLANTISNVQPTGTPITTLPAEDPLAGTYVDHDPPTMVDGIAYIRIGSQFYPLHAIVADGTLYGITGTNSTTGETTWVLHMGTCPKIINHPEIVPVVGSQTVLYSSYCASCLVVNDEQYGGVWSRTFRSKAEVDAEIAERMNPIVYVTPSGRSYHRPGCRHVRGSGSPVRKFEAQRQGYTSCRRCNP